VPLRKKPDKLSQNFYTGSSSVKHPAVYCFAFQRKAIKRREYHGTLSWYSLRVALQTML
jgi:hypothetical protein